MNTFDEGLGDVVTSKHAKGEWECTRCGYIRVGEKPPTICPECGATAFEFEFWEFEEDEDSEDDEDYE